MALKTIRRHSRKSIFLHWFNAACWFFLLATGIGLLDNKALQPFGMWWVHLMHAIFGSAANLLLVHEACGIVWALTFFVYSVVFLFSETLPFLKEIFSFSYRNDLVWLTRKMIMMSAGQAVLRKLGHDPELPAQGFYNAGQKMFAIPAVLGGIVIAGSGLVMVFSKFFADPGPVQWSILIHYTGVCLVLAGLLVHIFMASIAKGEQPAFHSMFTGVVPEEFAREHNALWYKSVCENMGNISGESLEPAGQPDAKAEDLSNA
jgi:formate dehydrogenase subunit gamma